MFNDLPSSHLIFMVENKVQDHTMTFKALLHITVRIKRWFKHSCKHLSTQQVSQ